MTNQTERCDAADEPRYQCDLWKGDPFVKICSNHMRVVNGVSYPGKFTSEQPDHEHDWQYQQNGYSQCSKCQEWTIEPAEQPESGERDCPNCEVTKAFHDVAVAERNHERHRALKAEAELASLKQQPPADSALEALRAIEVACSNFIDYEGDFEYAVKRIRQLAREALTATPEEPVRCPCGIEQATSDSEGE